VARTAGRSALRRQDGQALVLVLLTFVALIGFAALVVNVGHLVIAKVRLQNAADLTAFSAATIQARALNLMAKNNRDMEKIVKKWRSGDKKFDSVKQAEESIESECRAAAKDMKKLNGAYARWSLSVASEVGEYNFPGSEVFQVGIQKVKWESGSPKVHPYIARMNQGVDKVKLEYHLKKKPHEPRYYKSTSPYVTLASSTASTTNAVFWARLKANLTAFPWQVSGMEKYLPALVADSMAQPFGGHLGRPQGNGDITGVHRAYEVKFTRISHPDLKTFFEGPRWYHVAQAPGGGLNGEIVTEAQRLAYAH